MPLSACSPVYLHILQNLSLVLITVVFTPLSTLILILSILISGFVNVATWPCHGDQKRSSNPAQPRVVLVTGVGMSKGLFIARSFRTAGHVVIGADFEPYGIPVSGRFSTSLHKFYRLQSPDSSSSKTYIEALISIIREEKVDLWVSCSGVMSAIQDGEAAEAIHQHTKCKTIQFGVSLTKLLHEKDSFIANTKDLELAVPLTHLVEAVDETMSFLDSSSNKAQSSPTKYIMKCVDTNDSLRSDMTLLPLSTAKETREHISRLQPSSCLPFILQQFIRGREYCTHALVIRNQVKVFTACESADILMHYKALSSDDERTKKMLRYTEDYVEGMRKKGEEMTGHFSLDFLVDEDIDGEFYAIECNPRAHTAVVNISGNEEAMIEAYLSVLDDQPVNKQVRLVVPTSMIGHYWAGHDIVVRFFLPIFHVATGRISNRTLIERWKEFIGHLLYWKDPAFEIHDPVPAWWMYSIYWPSRFLLCIWNKTWWSRCNVSTGKIFAC